MQVVLAGPDRGLVDALHAVGATVARVEGAVTAEALRGAEVESADVFVLTDATEATAVPIVAELAPDATQVVYDGESVPEFARGQLDFAVDPDLLGPDVVAEELANGAGE